MLPATITQLPHLTRLDLHGNQITVLPDVMVNMIQLLELDLNHNPIAIPPELLTITDFCQLPAAQPILNYYFANRNDSQVSKD
jgi:Leucine-rich repeat (LRR) protein